MMLRQRRSSKSIRSMTAMLLFMTVLGMAAPANLLSVEAKETAAEDKKKAEEEKDAAAEEKKEEAEKAKKAAAAEDENKAEEKTEEEAKRDAAETDDEKPEAAEDGAVTVPVPIYNYDIANVLIPTSYSVALNPYELPIKTKDGTVSSAQVVSQNYGIVNKSTRDKVVTATFTIEDENEGKIVFVGSREEAMNADKDTYAVYLSVVPADSTGIQVDGADADKDILAEALSDVEMSKAGNHAVVLAEGENQISFKLSRAVYEFGGSDGIELGTEDGDKDKMPELAGLAEDSGGVTAFTFDGVMNPNANWSKLTKGVRISVTYAYENATGDEKIVDGTGAMIER